MKLSSIFCATSLCAASLSAGLWVGIAHAADSTQPVATSATALSQTTTTILVTDTALNGAVSQGDAIEQFVRGDFTTRRDMLNQWPASAEQLDQLVAYIDANELYSDATGNTYLFKDEQVLRYPSLEVVEQPSGFRQVTLINTLKQALNFSRAKIKLADTDPKQRLEAVEILESNPSQIDPELLASTLAKEQDAKVLSRLRQLQARLDIQSTDTAKQIEAANVLAGSNHPEVLALIQSKLAEPNLSAELTTALKTAESSVQTRLKTSEWSGHFFAGLSMASILLLAALGLAITYGLLGVINMAHGELIMIGAYTTYVMQGFFKTHFVGAVDWYLLAAIPAAFLVSAMVGMIIERIVIRPLYGRQLETLLATFGVSLILMQVIRMVFGAQNVEVTNTSWLSGGIALTPSLMLPYNRIAIIVFTVAVLLLLMWLIAKTRFGLFVRAVTQNRQMARAIGVRSARIDMMAFGLGSGLAGLAGCALAQIGNVGPDLGQSYIIDTFLVVVVGGVGQIMGATLAALGLGIGGT
ncbi:MAG: urea ABC transporter permease subunit UrtB, partial [Pseudomonadota bacterium]|nr:urea ABC transporter permease subunit UrtB [Pseudomonadota bacterium]